MPGSRPVDGRLTLLTASDVDDASLRGRQDGDEELTNGVIAVVMWPRPLTSFNPSGVSLRLFKDFDIVKYYVFSGCAKDKRSTLEAILNFSAFSPRTTLYMKFCYETGFYLLNTSDFSSVVMKALFSHKNHHRCNHDTLQVHVD